jgi:hypothetical protein
VPNCAQKTAFKVLKNEPLGVSPGQKSNYSTPFRYSAPKSILFMLNPGAQMINKSSAYIEKYIFLEKSEDKMGFWVFVKKVILSRIWDRDLNR